MPNQVVWIVVVIGLALLAFLIGGGMLNISKTHVGDIVNIFTGQKGELGSIKNMEDSCKAWIFGAEKYSSRAILETYLVPAKAGPFSTLTCCSQDLRNKALANVQGTISPDDLDFDACTVACHAVLQIADSCRSQCAGATEAQISKCLDSGIQASSNICSGTTTASLSCS